MSEEKREIEKTKKAAVKISVRNLVEFILREGDIDNRQGKSAAPQAMQEGSRMHRKIQKSMGPDYHAEVPLRLAIDTEDYLLVIEGRADGIIIESEDREITYTDNFNQIKLNEDGAALEDGTQMQQSGKIRVTIDEIKGIYKKLELLDGPIGVHRAQAMCYAYIYALQHELRTIDVQMTYCNLDTEDICYFRESFSFETLAVWFEKLILEYKKWADFQFAWRNLRQDSIKKLAFPFDYRKGQKELAAGVYRTILRKKTLFIQAPTGAGKTICTVFPAVKAVGEGLGEKIFYLTAKTITGTVAWDAFELLRKQGYQAKTIQITAKEKLCMCEEMDCNPVNCPYAKGHYDRVNDAVYELLQKEDMITREVLLEQAGAHMVCPFEMCLDTASWADNIICDYNYVFDPNVYLKRFFAEGTRGDYIFLVDEAHNLVERSREMYSASIYKEDFLEMNKRLKPMSKKLTAGLERCNRILLEYKRNCEKYVLYDDIGNLAFALQQLTSDLDEFLQKTPEFPNHKEVLDFYFQLCNFRNIYDLVDENYVIYSEHEESGRFKLKLYCVNPSKNLQERVDKGNATIFFSGTLLPIHYYKELLSARKNDYAIYAETSFLPEQKLLLIGKDVSSRYTRRNRAEFERTASYIYRTVNIKKGNYMVFFPSYKMMQQVYEVFCEIAEDRVLSAMQQTGMKEGEREEFLAAFSEERSKERETSFVAFCVLGGIFGEGIDLKNEQLIGAVIVGTGLPQISNEREILMNYYERVSGVGFDYAYRFPGMNKVLQAAGRVIRTTSDTGIIELLDERFLQSDYQSLFPREWSGYQVCSLNNVAGYLQEFWNARQQI